MQEQQNNWKKITFKEIIYLMSFFMYFFGSLFDFVISYTYWKANPREFFIYENNRSFVSLLLGQTNFVSILLLIGLPFLLLVFLTGSYYINKKWNNIGTNLLLAFLCFISFGWGAVHIVGGVSWW